MMPTPKDWPVQKRVAVALEALKRSRINAQARRRNYAPNYTGVCKGPHCKGGAR